MDLIYSPWAFISTSVFLGGLIGSPHCIMMCGPIVMNFAGNQRRLLAYQIGRMIGYTSVGAICGAIGREVLGDLSSGWLSAFSVLFIAILLVASGYRAFLGKSLHFPTPKPVATVSSIIWRQVGVSRLPRLLTAALAGVFTIFLPCGHLYGFLLGAVATGSAAGGALFMFAFWLGSAPLVSASGSIMQKILRPRVANGTRWAGVLLMVAGLMGVAAFGLRVRASNLPVHETPSAHTSGASVGNCH